MISKVTLVSMVSLLATMSAPAVFGAPSVDTKPPVSGSAYVPNVRCDRFKCAVVDPSEVPQRRPSSVVATDPLENAHPAGQRFIWRDLADDCELVPVGATPSDPYVYMLTKPIPVPLGSAYASLSGLMQSYIAGSGIDGSASMFGRLEIRRAPTLVSPNPVWNISDYGFVSSRSGTTLPSSRYGRAAYQGLENLANLAGGSGVPSMIEVRMVVHPFFTGGFVNALSAGSPGICTGNLEVAF